MKRKAKHRASACVSLCALSFLFCSCFWCCVGSPHALSQALTFFSPLTHACHIHHFFILCISILHLMSNWAMRVCTRAGVARRSIHGVDKEERKFFPACVSLCSRSFIFCSFLFPFLCCVGSPMRFRRFVVVFFRCSMHAFLFFFVSCSFLVLCPRQPRHFHASSFSGRAGEARNTRMHARAQSATRFPRGTVVSRRYPTKDAAARARVGALSSFSFPVVIFS